HVEDVVVDLVVVGDAGGVLAVQLVGCLGEGLVEVLGHGGPHDGLWPGAGVCSGKEVGDVVGVAVPSGLRGGERGTVGCFDGLQQPYGDADVIAQQRGQLVAGGGAVERFDRVADVGLV